MSPGLRLRLRPPPLLTRKGPPATTGLGSGKRRGAALLFEAARRTFQRRVGAPRLRIRLNGIGQGVVDGGADGGDLGGVALVGGGGGAGGVDLGGGDVGGAGEAGAQAEGFDGVVDDAAADDGGADDVAFVISRGDVGNLFDGGEDGLLEVGLRILAVADEVEAVGDGAGFEGLAVAGGEGRAEFGFVGVGGFVQVDVHEDRALLRGHQVHQGRAFAGGAVRVEGAVGVDRVGVPALEMLVAPGADARDDQQVGAAGPVAGVVGGELQGAVDAAGFVAVDAAG